MTAPITLETLWEQLNLHQNELLVRFAAIKKRMSEMYLSMNTLNEQITEMQMRVSRMEDHLESSNTKVQQMTKKVGFLETRLKYLENKSRQNNLVFFGFAEGEEKNDAVAFIQHFLTETLSFPRDLTLRIERAHRIPVRALAGTGRRPRPIIAKFGNYQHKAKVMALARDKGRLLYKDNRVYIYHDFSAEVQRKRQLFGPVKKRLNAAGIRYAMMFPALLSVEYLGERKRFETQLDAQHFLDSLDKSSASLKT